MATYRKTLDEIKAGRDWTKAEMRLLDEAHTGFVFLSGKRPTEETRENGIRAELVVHCVMGGCDTCQVPPKGVTIIGAWITGKIDLEGCRSDLALSLHHCHLDTAPLLQDARLGGLFLPGCKAPGISAHRLQSQTDVHMRAEFEATGPVALHGAQITGQLACDGGSFDSGSSDGDGGLALDCDAAVIGADVLLSTGFNAKGMVDLRRAKITGQLACVKGTFDGNGGRALNCQATEIGADVFLRDGFEAKGPVDFTRARIGGNLRCHKGSFSGGIRGEGMIVEGGFFFNDLTHFDGPLNLTDAEVGRLEDDKAAWEGADPILVSGFRYGKLNAALNAQDRLDVFRLGRAQNLPPDMDHFDPQPYTQLATTLRVQGNFRGASRVLHERDKSSVAASFHDAISQRKNSWRHCLNPLALLILWGPVKLWFFLTGISHSPLRGVGLLGCLIAVSTIGFKLTFDTGQFAPNSPVILNSNDWKLLVAAHDGDETALGQIATLQLQNCADGGSLVGQTNSQMDACVSKSFSLPGETPLESWLTSPSAKDYETFLPVYYSLDVLVPLVDLGQEAAWAPSLERGMLGKIAAYAKPLLQLSGWIISVLLAAALTGLVGRRE